MKQLNNQDGSKIAREMAESDLKLLGITAMEDLLQENVKECITDFQDAKIKVWMLTGDKGDTAEQIGRLCGLFRDFLVFKIEENENDTCDRLREITFYMATKDQEDFGFMIAGA